MNDCTVQVFIIVINNPQDKQIIDWLCNSGDIIIDSTCTCAINVYHSLLFSSERLIILRNNI